MLCRGLPRGNLAAKGCSRFVLKFDNYSITGDDSMFPTSLLQGAPLLACCCPRSVVESNMYIKHSYSCVPCHLPLYYTEHNYYCCGNAGDIFPWWGRIFINFCNQIKVLIGRIIRCSANHISFPQLAPKQEKRCQIKSDTGSICDSRQHYYK